MILPTARAVTLIGAPTDIGAADLGASMGPAALRVAGLTEALTRRGCAVTDRGDLAGPANPSLPPVRGYRHLQEVVAWNRAIYDAFRDELSRGQLPVLLGRSLAQHRLDQRGSQALPGARSGAACALV